MFWMKLHPPSVQVTETAGGCDINTEGYNIANYNVTRKVKTDIAYSGVTIIKERNRKNTLSRTNKTKKSGSISYSLGKTQWHTQQSKFSGKSFTGYLVLFMSTQLYTI